MYLLYSLLLTIALILLLPHLAYQILFKGKSAGSLRERLGFVPVLPPSDRSSAPEQRVIWFHAVSVGEVLAIRPLIEAVRSMFPDHRLVVSTTTATGQAVARAHLGGARGAGGSIGFCYFPFDLGFAVKRSMSRISPRLIVLVESELWPNFLKVARDRGIPVLVANGRISDRSYTRMSRWRLVSRLLYQNVSLFVMQSRADAERARKLGASADRVVVGGNLKYDVADPKDDEVKVWEGLDDLPLLIAGSTSDGEEEIILEAFRQIRSRPGIEDARLLIAPRHPERFNAVAELMRKRGLSVIRRSDRRNARDGQALLLDTIGELASLYRHASVVFIGGSLVPNGGHNILEPALYARPLIVGPHMENFREMTEEFLARDALLQVKTTRAFEQSAELAEFFSLLLSDRARARTLGENARRAVEDNRGATTRHLAAIAGMLRQRV
jgi:3-deoxy-D-manno-octulosonic-acid transferase